MNDLKGVLPPEAIQRNATYLAGQLKIELKTHSATAYATLLGRFSNELPGQENGNMAFNSVADYIGKIYDLRNHTVLRRVATNTLLVVHHQGHQTAEIEREAELSPGTLAKVKSGSPLAIKTSQVIILSSLLSIPFDLLFEDFTNRPNDLFQAIAAAAQSEGEEADDDDDRSAVGAVEEVVECGQGDLALALVSAGVVSEATDLSSPVPPSPSLVASRVRAAAKKVKMSLTDLLAKIGVNNRRHLEQIEKGEGAFTVDQLATMAVALGVEASSFLTGEGLDVREKSVKRASGTGSKEVGLLHLPSIKADARTDYFKARCLSRTVDLVDGADWREFLFATQSPDADWFQLWSVSTKQGADFMANIQKVAKATKPMGDIMKVEFMKLLYRELFPDTPP
jgi:transcriptional regulator with XRE-family HTH domain